MKRLLTYELLKMLRQGADCLDDEARQRICRYVESQRTPQDSFVNRGGKADLYYTLFGWMLCYALAIPSDKKARKSYLQTIDTTKLDTLHQTVLTLCHLCDRLLSLPSYTPDAILQLLIDDEPLIRFFETYQRHGSGGGTNAWAARLAMAEESNKALVGRLLSMQHESGGFEAHRRTIMPDMLSTAVALFALHEHSIPPRFDARPFIETHWNEDGSFAATLLDEHSDVEYVFYGLLAIGCTL